MPLGLGWEFQSARCRQLWVCKSLTYKEQPDALPLTQNVNADGRRDVSITCSASYKVGVRGGAWKPTPHLQLHVFKKMPPYLAVQTLLKTSWDGEANDVLLSSFFVPGTILSTFYAFNPDSNPQRQLLCLFLFFFFSDEETGPERRNHLPTVTQSLWGEDKTFIQEYLSLNLRFLNTTLSEI